VDGSGNVYIANTHSNVFSEWVLTNNTVTNLVTTGLNTPAAVAMDKAGNVYIGDSDNFTIKKWFPATGTLVTVTNDRISVGVPWALALDAAGDIFDVDYGYNRFIERTATDGIYTTLATGLAGPQGVSCDPGGNHVYITDSGHEAIKMWTPAGGVTTVISSGLFAPGNVVVDGSGNLYIANPATSSGSIISKWVAASGTLTTWVPTSGGSASTNLNSAVGIALDATGNLYIADANNQRILESPYAFVNTTPVTESGNAGVDVLPTVLPASENLLPPFAPSSDAGWLTITGTTNGVVSFAYTTNTGASSRTGHITVLGKATAVTQAVFIPTTPPLLKGVHVTGGGLFQFTFTNSPSATFTVWSATNLLTPFNNWTMAGAASNAGSGLFQFTSPLSTNGQTYYRVTSP
jgi:sugar lactone lactonase YvrE